MELNHYNFLEKVKLKINRQIQQNFLANHSREQFMEQLEKQNQVTTSMRIKNRVQVLNRNAQSSRQENNKLTNQTNTSTLVQNTAENEPIKQIKRVETLAR